MGMISRQIHSVNVNKIIETRKMFTRCANDYAMYATLLPYYMCV